MRYIRVDNIVKIRSLSMTQQIDLEKCKVKREGYFETYSDSQLGIQLKLSTDDIPLEFDSPIVNTRREFIFHPQAKIVYDDSGFLFENKCSSFELKE